MREISFLNELTAPSLFCDLIAIGSAVSSLIENHTIPCPPRPNTYFLNKKYLFNGIYSYFLNNTSIDIICY